MSDSADSASARSPERGPARRPRIIIAGGGFSFPNGTGSTARVRTYADALRAVGADVSVVVLMVAAPGTALGLNNEVTGSWRGVPFEHPAGVVEGPASFLGRRRAELRGSARMRRIVRDAVREGGLDAVLLYGPEMRWILALRAICSRYGVQLVNECNEFPFVRETSSSAFARLRRWAYLRTAFRMFDGLIVISRLLEETLTPLMRRGAWVLRIPILVDADAYAEPAEKVDGLVVYAGNLGHPEEIEDLIAGAAGAVGAVPGLRVRILGSGDAAGVARIRRYADEHAMSGRVEMPGQIAADEMPRELARASALALPRRAGLFSQAGMPTKLAEYLATGRPVVVTRTGDIGENLTDHVDAYLVEPGDVTGFTRALVEALADPSATEVGRRGRETAMRRFDPEAHMRRLLEAIRRDRRR